ncbi:putative S-adenosyl-L-methionine-dependent methyltransferase [Helianthus annuus]|nr:putative S-adenosyl-L-methionine-dependent methyltransferase [Helianthus annuus]KAJ0590230.1 putative S-adenosyl-L-methionine-dependent methyltransferase [Helianthus annuus]KAJ0598064.1 putative S-adenosyl-L-methionine-dependent methyltransferase [Helianthus annuus]KAJ0928173.1 putative S-adenosyl-L-methionine-dependent methyltransferase [Helianthus annuus]KAJ0932543.1 putative S-adenosyl-L-methionine-dependent methyltransferase [Helianthus annuus]
MGFTMGLNLLLLLAMVATNILSLYHLSTTMISTKPPTTPTPPVPDHLLRQLQTIRATITHLTRHHSNPSLPTTPSTIPSELLLYTQLSPIASSCRHHPDLLHQYMNYTPFSPCPPPSSAAAEPLILRGCHPLPRRRCFSPTPNKQPTSLPTNPFSPVPEYSILWNNYKCKNFNCLNPDLGFDLKKEKSKLLTYKTDLDLPISQLTDIAKKSKIVIRLALDIGGGTGTFAAQMKEQNVTVITTTMSLGAPYNEVAALRGLVPLHVPLQQRLPVFDGVLDLVRCGHAVNRWIPVQAMEFLVYDVDRVLRGGGFFWVDRFFSKGVDLDKVYAPLIGKLGYKKVKWAVGKKTDSSGVKNDEVYLTALLQKPVSR